MTISLAEDVIMQAKDVYMAQILKHLAHVDLPDWNDPKSKNYAHGNYFTISQDPNNVIMDWVPASNGFYLLIQNLSGVAYCSDFHYKAAPLLVATGHADVKMNKINLGVGFTFTNQTTPDGRMVPAITTWNVLVDIDRNDINIQIWGNFWSTLASAFEIFFKSTVVDEIKSTMNYILADAIPLYSNAFLKKNDGFIKLTNTFEIDWMTPAAAIFAPDAFEIGIEANFFDNAFGEQYPADTIPVLPYRIANGAGF